MLKAGVHAIFQLARKLAMVQDKARKGKLSKIAFSSFQKEPLITLQGLFTVNGSPSNHFVIFSESQSRGWWSCGMWLPQDPWRL